MNCPLINPHANHLWNGDDALWIISISEEIYKIQNICAEYLEQNIFQ